MIQIKVEVKFRAFGITFGTVKEEFRVQSPVMLPPGVLFSISERGVDLYAEVV